MKIMITTIISAAAGIAVAIALQGTIKGCITEPNEARKDGKNVVYIGTDSNGNAQINIAGSQNKLVVVTNKVKVVSFY